MSIICHPVDLSTVISAGLVTFNESLLQDVPIQLMLLVSSVTTVLVSFTSWFVVVVAASVTDEWLTRPPGVPSVNLLVLGSC